VAGRQRLQLDERDRAKGRAQPRRLTAAPEPGFARNGPKGPPFGRDLLTSLAAALTDDLVRQLLFHRRQPNLGNEEPSVAARAVLAHPGQDDVDVRMGGVA